MKRPMIDYRELRFSTVNEPRFRHVWLALSWIGYFAMYVLTEHLIPAERCRPVHIPLDDLIPFNEYFVLFYVGWYVLVFFSLLYYLLYDAEQFKRLQWYIIITQVIAMACYILYPTRQDLRPDSFAHDNFLTQVVAYLYSFDTNTGVCPSLHAGYSFAILSVQLRDRNISLWWKVTLTVLVICICLSVCFIKQHSALDVFAAIPMCLVAELLIFGRRKR